MTFTFVFINEQKNNKEKGFGADLVQDSHMDGERGVGLPHGGLCEPNKCPQLHLLCRMSSLQVVG